MSTLALNIRMDGKYAVIIGGGAVAFRKLKTLLKAGAFVNVVAETVCSEIVSMDGLPKFVCRIGSYRKDDLNNAFLVIAATDNAQINEEIRSDASKMGILVTVADNPTAGDCVFPATLIRGDLQIAISTEGRCPTFAADVRDKIAEQIGVEYIQILDKLAEEREKLLTNGSSSTYNTQVLRSLSKSLLAELPVRKESIQ